MRAVMHPEEIWGHRFQLGGHFLTFFWEPIVAEPYHFGSGCNAGGAVKETEK